MIKTKKDHKSALNQPVLWHLSKMAKDFAQRELPPGRDRVAARQHCLQEEIDTPDLVTSKNFFRIYIATSHGKIEEKATSDSVNAFAEQFFTDFWHTVLPTGRTAPGLALALPNWVVDDP